MFHSRDITYYILSLGCSKNLVDAELVNGSLMAAGYRPVYESDEADIILVNTCGFIEPAREESIEVIFDALDSHQALPRSKPFTVNGVTEERPFPRRVAVMGCLSKRYFDEIGAEIPEIDFLYGIPDENFVPELSSVLGISIEKTGFFGRVPITKGLPYSYIKIAEGCSHRCSYCAIPLIRGERRSFAPEEIIADAEAAARGGAKELILIAQDITRYRSRGTGLPELVARLDRIDGAEWIRLMYCHPDFIDDSLIQSMADNEKVVPYIDIPFQHVSERILSSMGRKGNFEIYLSLVNRLREMVPGIGIRSTFMVGYPGETEDNFRELLRFLTAARIDRAGAFVYSPEVGTRAADLGNRVPKKTAEGRYHELMAMQQDISLRKLESLVGRNLSVMVEERIDEKTYVGRTEYDAPEVDGFFYLTADEATLNTIVKARVTDAVEYDLMGVLC